MPRFYPSREELQQIVDIIKQDLDYNTPDCGYGFIISGVQYATTYLMYRKLKEGPYSYYLDILKDRYPLESTMDGKLIKPVHRKLVIVHMLEVPLQQLPLYLNSEDSIVKKLASWRISLGH